MDQFKKWRAAMIVVLLLLLPGCRGCDSFTTMKVEKKDPAAEKKEPQSRLDVTDFQSLPSSSQSDSYLMKSGHWYQVQNTVRANFGDESLNVTSTSVDQTLKPLSVLGLREQLFFERTATLAKGQKKRFEYNLFLPNVPPVLSQDDNPGKPALRFGYYPRLLGPAVREEIYPVTIMPEYQHYMVVLSKNPQQYQFLNGLSAIIWPSTRRTEEDKITPFRVVSIAQDDAQNNLPSRLTTWTTTSHLLWNDCDASSISEDQRNAILDWIQFGGQLIVNGPESQAALRSSFLSPYLPLENIEPNDPDEEEWKRMSAYWSISRLSTQEITPIQLPENRKIPTIRGKLTEGAEWVSGCEGLLAQRRIGAGRIVMTQFPIQEDVMIKWPSYGSFFHGAILHLPPRTWEATEFDGDMRYVDKWKGKEVNPEVLTNFRLMARDLGRIGYENFWLDKEFTENSDLDQEAARREELAMENQFSMQQDPHLARTNDVAKVEQSSIVTNASLQTLKEASGIQVPKIKTVIQLLLSYLAFLVPLNWLVFRIIGRVELAWVAAPVIALVGAIVVARSVQLDVGFSRSQALVNVLELKSGYNRGHMASHASLYTSLSTNYSARYPTDAVGFVLPYTLGNDQRRINTTSLLSNAPLIYQFEREEGNGIASFPVRSNSTSFLRSEEVIELNGGINLQVEDNGHVVCENRSGLDLENVAVLGKDKANQFVKAWIGKLNAGDRANGTGEVVATTFVKNRKQPRQRDFWFSEWDRLRFSSEDSAVLLGEDTTSTPSEDTSAKESQLTKLKVAQILSSILKSHVFGPDEWMLISTTDESLSSLTIQPVASQQSERSVVIVRSHPKLSSKLSPDRFLPSKLPENQVSEPENVEPPESDAQ